MTKLISGVQVFICFFAINLCKPTNSEYKKIFEVKEKIKGADAVIKNFHAEGISQNKNHWKLVANSAYIFRKTGIIKIVDLQMKYYRGGKLNSRVSSKYGEYDKKAGKVQAQGKVFWKAVNGRSLRTETLLYDQKTGKLSSNKFTKITFPDGDYITGYGFKADQKLDRYVLYGGSGIKKVE